MQFLSLVLNSRAVDHGVMELLPLVVVSLIAIVSTVVVTARDGYRRVPRKF